MNPVVATALLTAGAGGLLELGRRGVLAPEAADWWRRARAMLNAQWGIPPQPGQTLHGIHRTLMARAMADVGPNHYDSAYPAPTTTEDLSLLCSRWLSAFPLWMVTLADAEVPQAYRDVAERRATHAWGTASDLGALKTWQACGALARIADAMRAGDIATGVGGDHPDGFLDFVGVGARRTAEVLKGPLIGAAKGVLFDPALDLFEDVVVGALPSWQTAAKLALAVAVVGAGVYLLYHAVAPNLPGVGIKAGLS